MERLTIVEDGQVRIVGMNARNELNKVVSVAHRLAEFENLGCEPEELQKAREKQIPKEPAITIQKDDVKIGNATWKAGTKVHMCMSCYSWISPIWKYCAECGQSIGKDPICNTTKLPCAGCNPCCESRK